jgi:chorismate synthase
MTRLRLLTAGESHGPALLGILEGLPAGLPLEAADLDRDLARRQAGHGRGGRMRIERDRAELLAGVRYGATLGTPLGVLVRNLDHAAWAERMAAGPGGPDPRPVTVPRPGHADLAGGLKYGHTADLRNVLERASARETAMRVALGAAARAFLRDLGIEVGSYVRSIGAATAATADAAAPDVYRGDAEALALLADRTATRALDEESSARLAAEIDRARERRDTVGGVIEVVATHVPVGLGSHVQADRRLDGRLGAALLALPAVKAVEFGDGWAGAARFGSEVHDPIAVAGGRLARRSNHAGGLEGGITDGEPLVLRAAMKPIATVPAALPSVDLATLAATAAHVERSDTCAVPALGVVAEAAVALALADAVLETLGGDTVASLRLPFARLRLAPRTAPGAVFLIGPAGSGKTTAGAALARALALPFVDLDARVEAAAGAPIPAIFAGAGEAEFRRLEARALADAAAGPPAVVAAGGGAPLSDAAWRRMRSAGAIVRLSATPETCAKRLAGAAFRPLLAGDPLARLAALAVARERWYARADLTLGTDDLAAAEVAGRIAGLLETLNGPFSRTRIA